MTAARRSPLSMVRHHSRQDALVAFMLPKVDRSSAALRTVRDLTDRYGWLVAWHAAVEAVYSGTDPAFALATFEGWCRRLGEAGES